MQAGYLDTADLGLVHYEDGALMWSTALGTNARDEER